MESIPGGRKSWIFRNKDDISPDLESWAGRLNISALLAGMLWRRGFDSTEAMNVFLSPNLRLLAPPGLWAGVEESADVIVGALAAGKKPVVWGDYDVDGITASALVLDVFEFHGIEAGCHLPDRLREGYGLNIPAIEELAAQGAGLLVTVDCGISDFAAVERARELGMTVVISDHHLAPEILPPAQAICNPRIGSCPCPDLAGVGIAFFLMCAVNAKLAESGGKRCDMREVLDLVALGTLADVVSLSSQNRILAKNGLLKIAEAVRPGIAALKSRSNINPMATLTSGQVVFRLAPRINAAGRLGRAEVALDLLRARSHDEAAPLADALEVMNSERKSEEERICREAREAAETLLPDARGLVLYGKDWHPGIIGIVASRIVDEFNRPTIVLCEDQGVIKGSGRSIPAFDLYAGLASLSDLLLGFGGHRQAAGMRLALDKLEIFRSGFNQVVRAAVGDESLRPEIALDAELGFKEAGNLDFLNELKLMQPFGPGNSEPVFSSLPLVVKKRNIHQQWNLVTLDLQELDSGITLGGKIWRNTEAARDLTVGNKIKIAYSVQIDNHNGVSGIDLRIKDWMFVK